MMASNPISILNGWQPNNFAQPANALQGLSNYASAPVSDMSGYVPPDPTQGPAGIGALVSPAQQQNILQQLQAQQGQMQPTPDQQAMPQYQTQPPQQQAAPINPLQQAGMPQGQLPDQAAPGGNTPRKRLSALDVIGRLSDVFAKVGGAPEQYQPYLDNRVKTAQEQEASGLDNTAKRGDIAQTEAATSTAHNALLGQAFRGLKAIQTAGGNLQVAWPAMAQQLGIGHAEAAQIGAQLAQDPNALDGYIAATDVAKGGESKYGQQLFYTTDGNGVRHAYQTNSAGGVQEVQFGPGEHPADSLMDVDTGDRRVLTSKTTGNVIRSFVKSGAPEAGYQARVDDAGHVTSYTPVPGSKAAITNAEAVQKQQEAASSGRNAYSKARSGLVNLVSSMDDIANDPGLSSATGASGVLTRHLPAGVGGGDTQRILGKIEALKGKAIPSALNTMRDVNGKLGFRPSQVEILGDAKGLLGAVDNTGQSRADYVKSLNTNKQLILKQIEALDADAQRNGYIEKPAQRAPVPNARPVTPKAPAGWKISVVG